MAGPMHALQAMRAIVWREVAKFSRQTGRLVSALVRPLLWLAVFAAGFRNVFGMAIAEPYDTYIAYDVYIAPGLIGIDTGAGRGGLLTAVELPAGRFHHA